MRKHGFFLLKKKHLIDKIKIYKTEERGTR